MAPSDHPRPHVRTPPLALLTVGLCVAIAAGTAFLTPIVAPVAILVTFCVGFAVSDWTKRDGS